MKMRKRFEFVLALVFVYYINGVILSCSSEVETEYITKTEYVTKTDTTVPAKISDLVKAESDSCVLLTWTNPVDEDFYGTKITFTPVVSGITNPIVIEGRAGASSSAKILGLQNSTNYTFTLTALDKSQNASQSTEIIATPKTDVVIDITPPATVTNLEARNKGGAILLSWVDASDEDIYGYEVQYEATSESRSVVSTALSANTLVVPQGKGGVFVSNLVNETEYLFTVITVDTSGNKSAGATVSGKPTASVLQVVLSVPSDGDTIVLNNEKVPVVANISSTADIKKVVWKLGIKNRIVKPATLLADSEATEIPSQNESGAYEFYAYENGWYDVAVIDSDGRMEWNQIEVKTIDKISLAPITNLEGSVENNMVSFAWIDPASVGRYNSGLNYVEIVYSIDSETEHHFIQNTNAGVQQATFAIPTYSETTDCIEFIFIPVDCVGNRSASRTWLYYPNTCELEVDEVASYIESLQSSQTIVVKPEVLTSEIYTQILTALRGLNDGIYVQLDLSQTTGLEAIPEGTSETAVVGGNFIYLNACNSLKSIKLPTTIRAIGDKAFLLFSSLESVEIPDEVTSIGSGAFNNTALKSVEIPSHLSEITDGTFAHAQITRVSIPENITNIGQGAFSSNSLEYVEFSSSVTSLGYKAFGESEKEIHYDGTLEEFLAIASEDLSHDRNYTCHNAVVYINGALLTDVYIPETFTEVSSTIFQGCTSIKTVTYSEAVTTITPNFAYCPNLEYVDTGDGATEVEQSAFRYCDSLKKVRVGSNVIRLRDCVFLNSNAVEEIVFALPNAVWKGINTATSGTYTLTVNNPAQNAQIIANKNYNVYSWNRQSTGEE